MPCCQPRGCTYTVYTVCMVRTVCAPLVYTIEALASPARGYDTRCSLRLPCSGKPARQDTRRGLCAEPSSNRPAHTLYRRRGLWLTPACVRHLSGKHVALLTSACGPAEEQHSCTCDCTSRRPCRHVQRHISSRSWTRSIRCRSCSTFRPPNFHRSGIQPAVRSAHARHPAVWPRPLRAAPDPLSPAPRGFTKLPPKVPHCSPLVGWSVVFGRTQGRQRLVGRPGYGAQVR